MLRALPLVQHFCGKLVSLNHASSRRRQQLFQIESFPEIHNSTPMKRFFPILLLLVLAATLSTAQSGGTSIDQHVDRLSRKLDRLAVKLESKIETAAVRIEGESERLADKADEVSVQLEDKWDSDWSVRLEKLGKNLDIRPCPEVAYLGIESHEVSFEKAQKLGFENHFGSYVSKVLAESSAQKAGLQAFDYIYGVNDQRTSDNQNLSDILEDFEVGDEVTLHLIRKGEKMSVTVKLGDYDYDLGENEEVHPFLGVSPSDNEADDLSGVAVDVVEKSTAEEMGLKVGDVLTSINGYPVLDWEDVTTAIQNTRPGDAIEVSFLRDEKPLSAKGTIKSYQDVYPEDESGNWNLNIDWDEMGNVQIATGDDWEQGEEQDENRAFIGIYTEMISQEKAKKLGFDNPFGAYITGIISNSGAEKAGLKPFDYIFGFDEYRVGEEQNLGVITKKFKPGQMATVHYFRQGKAAKASLTFTRPYKVEKPVLNSCEDPFLGVNLIEDPIEAGIVVKPVGNSTATDLGLQEGDILTHINGYKMVDWQDVATAVDLMNPGEAISVNFIRGDKQMRASKPIKSYAQTKNCADCDCGGKASVVVATVPGVSNGRGWPSTTIAASPTPRVNVGSVKTNIENLTGSESNSLKNKGVQISETSNLKVENLQVSPNASTGLFDLNFNLNSKGNTAVRIFNPAGRMLYEYDLGSFNGKFSDSVDISQNGIGSYFLEINQDGKVFTKKITLSKN